MIAPQQGRDDSGTSGIALSQTCSKVEIPSSMSGDSSVESFFRDNADAQTDWPRPPRDNCPTLKMDYRNGEDDGLDFVGEEVAPG